MFKDVFVLLLVRLFNAIFDSGNFLSIWTEGIIIPLLKKGHANERERERNVLFNDALNTFYLRLYGIRHMVKDHSDSEK